MDFAVSASHRVHLKESEKRDKYPDLARELKKHGTWKGNGDSNHNRCVWNNLQRISKGTRRLRNQRQQHYQDQPEYWEESWRLEETCCHSKFNEKLSARSGVKNS